MNICVVNVLGFFQYKDKQLLFTNNFWLSVSQSDFHNKSLLSIKLHLTHVNIFIHGINYRQLHETSSIEILCHFYLKFLSINKQKKLFLWWLKSSTGCGSNWGQETSCQLVSLDSTGSCVSNGQRLGCSSDTSSRDTFRITCMFAVKN